MFARLLILTILFLGAYVEAATSLYYVDANPVLRVRAYPGLDAEVIKTLPYGKAVRIRRQSPELDAIDGKRGRWVLIQYDGDEYGFVFDAYLSKQTRNTRARTAYRRGNNAFKKGNYSGAQRQFQRSIDSATNEIEVMKSLGGLAETYKAQGDMSSAVSTAKRILRIDSTNEYALRLAGISSSPARYSQINSCPNRLPQCLALTWGPDVCGPAFRAFAELLGEPVYDVVTSPGCLVGICAFLGESCSPSDYTYAAGTGLLDDIARSGKNSQNDLERFFADAAGLASFGIKVYLFTDCMSNCR